VTAKPYRNARQTFKQMTTWNRYVRSTSISTAPRPGVMGSPQPSQGRPLPLAPQSIAGSARGSSPLAKRSRTARPLGESASSSIERAEIRGATSARQCDQGPKRPCCHLHGANGRPPLQRRPRKRSRHGLHTLRAPSACAASRPWTSGRRRPGDSIATIRLRPTWSRTTRSGRRPGGGGEVAEESLRVARGRRLCGQTPRW